MDRRLVNRVSRVCHP